MSVQLQLPTCFIVGVQKYGTSTLGELLHSHSEITLGKSKEMNILGCHDEERRIYAYQEWLKPNAQVRIDASVSYLYNDFSLERMKEFYPASPKIIVMLREPAGRTLSAYWHYYSAGLEKRSQQEVFNFGADIQLVEAIKQEKFQVRTGIIQGKIVVHEHEWRFPDPSFSFHYAANSDYVRLISKLYQMFGREHVYVEFAENLRDQQANVLKGISEFLGVDAGLFPDIKAERDANVRLVPVQNSKGKLLRKVRDLVPGWVKEKLPHAIINRYRKSVYSRPQNDDPQVNELLKKLFQPELEKLEQLLGCKLPDKWRK